MPNKVLNVHNNASTFKPYDAGEAIGNVNPTIPEPPPPPQKDKGCGGFAKVIAIAVSVVVAIYAPQMASMTYSALLGAAGSAVSQGVLIAGGVQDSFSWKSVAMAGVSAGVGSGLPSAASLPSTIARGMASNAITQGVAVAVGAQDRFDWKGVAISGASAGLGYGAGRAVNAMGGSTDMQSFTRGLTAGASSAAMRGTVHGEEWAYIVGDAVGATVGSRVAANAAERSARQAVAANVDSSFLARYPTAMASNTLVGGDVRRDNAISPTPGWENGARQDAVIPPGRIVDLDPVVVRAEPEYYDVSWMQDARRYTQADAMRDVAQDAYARLATVPSGPTVQAKQYGLRDGVVNSMRGGGLGNSTGGRRLIGVTDAYLHLPETALGAVQGMAALGERVTPIGMLSNWSEVAAMTERSPSDYLSAYRSGLEALRKDAFDVMYGDDEAGGRFLFNAAIGVAAPERLLARGGVVPDKIPLPGEPGFIGPLIPDSILANRQVVQNLGIPAKLSPRQDLHLPPVTDGRSVLTADPSALVNGLRNGEFNVLRQPKPGQVVVDFGRPIGDFWSIRTGQPTYVGPTNYGSVMYGKNGTHIVPANPDQW